MSGLVWVARETLFSLHEASIARFGGTLGMRDSGLLESALHRPQNAHAYGEKDIFILASALGGGIIKNHPFLDGNNELDFWLQHFSLSVMGKVSHPPNKMWS